MIAVSIWVDPAYGTDPDLTQITAVSARINDSTAPCKRLQVAIDACQIYLAANYVSNPPSATVGIVWALPGIYGPEQSGDTLPIQMRDRVNVRGLDARGCIIRGAGVTNRNIFWPNAPSFGSSGFPAEVLVDFTNESDQAALPPFFSSGLPWAKTTLGSGDSLEFLDSFTLQRGDVQVLFGYMADRGPLPLPLKGRVSNCVFDMRDNWPEHPNGALVHGPFFGVMMQKLWNTGGGYYDQQAIIINNTFVMAEFGYATVNGTLGWIHDARPDAVAIIDVTDPGCAFGVPHDKNMVLRGVGNPMIANNLFRTRYIPTATSATKPMATLGIAKEDVQVHVHSAAGFGPTLDTNAFASGRVGSDNKNGASGAASFFSVPTSSFTPSTAAPYLWDCQGFLIEFNNTCGNTMPAPPCAAAPLPTPVRYLYENNSSGFAEYDPGFVGEYLNNTKQVFPTTAATFYTYRDWRLLPDSASPFKDLGVDVVRAVFPYADYISTLQLITASSPPADATSYFDPDYFDLRLFRWDGEGHGNPRVVNGAPDIGFDEIHAMVMAGSYANDSNSHNLKDFLAPQADNALPDRYVLFPQDYVGANVSIQIDGTQRPFNSQPAALPAWSIPPAALNGPVTEAGHPPDYDVRYINLSNPPSQQVPTPWTPTAAPQPIQWLPINGQNANQKFHFTAYKFTDSEHSYSQWPNFKTGYFCTQTVLTGDLTSSAVVRFTNLQWEFR